MVEDASSCSRAAPGEGKQTRLSILRPSGPPAPVPPRGIVSCFLEAARRRPGQRFLDYQSSGVDAPARRETFRYADFARAVGGAVALLRDHDVRGGDTVALMMRNSPELLALHLAAAAMGVVTVPLDGAATVDELSYPLRRVDPKVLLVRPDLEAKADRLVRGLRGGRPAVRTVAAGAASTWAAQHRPVSEDELPQVGLDEVAVVVFTSGTTTARPKGVMLTHRNMFQGPQGFATELGVTEEDAVLVVTPMHHVNALQFGIGAAITAGATVCLVDRFSAQRFWATVRTLEPSILWTMGGILSILLAREVSPDEVAARGLLRAVFAAAVGAEHEQVRRRVAPLVMECYGMSEFSGGTCTLPGRNGADDSVAPSVGTPLPHLELMVVDPLGAPVPVGEVGEIVAVLDRSTVMAGYLDEPELTAAVFRDGLLWSGDLGFVGPVDGQLHFVGRTKDMIRRGGVNISAMEVENVLQSHPAVVACAVVPAPDPVLGEVVVGFVTCDSRLELRYGELAEELRAYCRGALSAHKVPERVIVVDHLPMTATGKVRKAELRGRLDEGYGSVDYQLSRK